MILFDELNVYQPDVLIDLLLNPLIFFRILQITSSIWDIIYILALVWKFNWNGENENSTSPILAILKKKTTFFGGLKRVDLDIEHKKSMRTTLVGMNDRNNSTDPSNQTL